MAELDWGVIHVSFDLIVILFAFFDVVVSIFSITAGIVGIFSVTNAPKVESPSQLMRLQQLESATSAWYVMMLF